jgi:ribonuclease Y
MSDEKNPFSGEGPPETEEEINKRQKELQQRKRGLDDFSDELDEREEELESRQRELREKKGELDEREERLGKRETHIEELEAELNDRQVAVEERERELSERADELDEKEQVLREYVGDSVRQNVEDAVSNVMKSQGGSRLGTIGTLVLGLVGVALIVTGVLNAFSASIGAVPVVFETETANLGVTVVLVFSGLAANLTAVAD